VIHGTSRCAATYLAELETLAVGIDYLSVGSPEVHRTLFGAGVAVIEGLNLSDVNPGEYDLLCLPLRITGSDGAPPRALLRPPSSAATNGISSTSSRAAEI
jgi:arylformamidase